MSLLIAAATAKELEAALPDMKGKRLLEQVIYTPEQCGRNVYACVTGVGPVNAALAMGLASGCSDIDSVLNIGLAGAFSLEELPLCTSISVCEEVYAEYGLCGGNGVAEARTFGFPQWSPEGEDPVFSRILLKDAEKIPGIGIPAGMPKCTCLTVAGVSADRERADALYRKHRASAEAMEGFSIALACARLGYACAEIRCISNLVGSREAHQQDFAGALHALETTISDLFNV